MVCKRARHLGSKDVLDRSAKAANCACPMDQNGVTTEDMDAWELLFARREEQPLPTGRWLIQIAKITWSGFSLPQQRGVETHAVGIGGT